ncbi:flagellar hook-length control protein FliK [Alloacidobacterium dinghuense]|uniref:Flagellar hook-length control protein FliK n=1 Tax=Alloacidobacterium dinghuense TaxID=2763107 RepID=A0A7G8BNP0_9BACT|nr:flagellar hook-length control protein FliK [Alloacidobacterium dinghuense]QNI34160.1 flagellar hook-length control protein FliK [Alloacidobacterium dinghuense]
MQVPASAASTTGVQESSASVSAGPFGSMTGAASPKKGQLPAFAAILAEQSGSTAAEKNTEVLTETADAKQEAAPLGPDLLLRPPFEELRGAGAQEEAQFSNSVPAKNEAKAARHETEPSPSSANSPKKQNAIVADLALASGAIVPVPLPIPQADPIAGPEKWSPALPVRPWTPDSVPLQQHVSSGPGLQKEPREQASVASLDAGRPEGAAALPMVDSAKNDLGALPIASERLQIAPPSVTPEALASTPNNLPHSPLSQTPADIPLMPVISANMPLHTVSGPVVEGAAPQVAGTPSPRQKTAEKPFAAAGHGISASAVTQGSTKESVQTQGDTLPNAMSARTVAAAGPGVRSGTAASEADPFQRLDAVESPATLLHTSSHQIAVGVHDPALGWVEVQTQSSAGHVSATLTADSTEAHASLAAQAPSITQYLADRNVPVHSLNVHTQGDMQSGASGGGQSQSAPGDARRDNAEQGGAGTDKKIQSPLNDMRNENVSRAVSASYISIHA